MRVPTTIRFLIAMLLMLLPTMLAAAEPTPVDAVAASTREAIPLAAQPQHKWVPVYVTRERTTVRQHRVPHTYALVPVTQQSQPVPAAAPVVAPSHILVPAVPVQAPPVRQRGYTYYEHPVGFLGLGGRVVHFHEFTR